MTAKEKITAWLSKDQAKQPTRMLKCFCENCGYTIRATAKWLNIAIPNCPNCKSELTRVE